MRALLRRSLAVATKEVRHILRDPQSLAFALGMPVLLIFLFGFAVNFDIDRVPLVIVDQEQTAASRRLVESFSAAGTFAIVARRDDPAAIEPLFRTGVAKAALVLPPGFTRRGLRGEEAVAQLLIDGSDNTSAAVALGYASVVALAASQTSATALLGQVEVPLQARVRTFFNPGLRSAVFLVPGLMVLILVMVAVIVWPELALWLPRYLGY